MQDNVLNLIALLLKIAKSCKVDMSYAILNKEAFSFAMLNKVAMSLETLMQMSVTMLNKISPTEYPAELNTSSA